MDEPLIKMALYQWLTLSFGLPHVFTITFDADFVTGNSINGTFDGESFAQVDFDTTHDVTMLNLLASIRATAKIFKATLTGAREITCQGAVNGDTIICVGPTVTGGASQAVATIATTQAAVLVPVIYADQVDNTGRNAPRPNGPYPYATLRLGSIEKVGWDETRDVDPVTFLSETGGQRIGTVAINYYGPNPMREMSKAYNSLETQRIHDLLYAAGIAISDKNNIQNLTGMLETRFEERAFFDFFILFSENTEEDLGAINSVEITGNYHQDGSLGTDIYSVELNGDGQFIQTPISVDPSNNDFTVMVSVYNRTYAFEPITGNPVDNVAFYSQADGGGTGRTWLGIRYRISPLLIRTTTNFNNTFRNANHVPFTGRWENHCVRYDSVNNLMQIFIDGVLDIEYTNIIPESASGMHRIGSNKTATLNEVNGYIGPCAFYNRVLSDEEIFQFTKNLIVPESRSTNDFYYPMTDGTGNISDVLNGNDGQIIGGNWSNFKYNGFPGGPIVLGPNVIGP